MYIQTKLAVTYNLPMKGTASSKIRLIIENTAEDQGLERLNLKFKYLNEDDQIIGGGIGTYSKADMDALMDEIKGSLPNINETAWTLWRKTQLYTAAIKIMAEKLEIEESEIEIITEAND